MFQCHRICIEVNELILPGDTHRLAILGRTGSGKTQAAVWHLSRRSFDTMPWIVFNFKGDDLIDAIPGTYDLDIDDRIPSRPGIYIVRPLAVSKDDKEALDGFFQRCWRHEKVGLYIDEGYVATGLKWFRACLTQGRSRRVPMIVLSQRPVWIDTFVWSEADFFQAFHLNRKDDRDLASTMLPGYRNLPIPEYHSLWHDVTRDCTMLLAPVPDRDQILQTFRDRSPVQRRLIA